MKAARVAPLAGLLSLTVGLLAAPAHAATADDTDLDLRSVSGVCSAIRPAPADATAEQKQQVAQAKKLAAAIKAALTKAARNDSNRATLRIMIHDDQTGLSCGYNAHKHVITRSVAKVAISAALLRQLEREHARPSKAELTDIRRAIRYSDNNAAQRLHDDLGDGVTVMHNFYRIAGMRDAVQTNPKGRWGNVLTSPSDQVTLLRLLTDGSDKVLKNKDKQLILGFMRSVAKTQRWGISEGAPARASIAIKNGWGPASTESGWIVNSIGYVAKRQSTYELVVMSNHNGSFGSGIHRIERAARLVNKAASTAS